MIYNLDIIGIILLVVDILFVFLCHFLIKIAKNWSWWDLTY